MAMSFKGITDWLGSRGGQTAVMGIGAGLNALGQGRQRTQDRAFQQEQFGAQARLAALQNALATEQSRTTRAGDVGLGATSLGDEEAYRAKQALMAQILGNMRNVRITPGDAAVAAAMPQISGGAQLPEGGLPAGFLANFDPSVVEGAIQRRRDQLSKAVNTQPSDNESRIQAAIDQLLASEQFSIPKKKKKTSIWGRLGRIALPAALGALTGGWGAAVLGGASGALPTGGSRSTTLDEDI